jgi:uncharacterized membrane protein YhdT
MEKKLKLMFILGMFFLFSLTLVSAVPPVQSTIVAPEGLEIESANFDYLPQNSYHNFRFRVYNATNNVYLNGDDVNCSLGIIDDMGEYVYGNSDVNNTGYVFSVNLTGGNFSEIGLYHKGINCITDDGTSAGGVLTQSFEVTPLGEGLTTSISFSYIGLIAIFVFLFLVNMGAIAWLDGNRFKPDENGKIIDKGSIAYVKPILYVVGWAILLAIMFISSNFALGYLNFEMMGNALFTIYKIMMYISLPLIVFWIIWIFVRIFQDNEYKRMIERGAYVGDI